MNNDLIKITYRQEIVGIRTLKIKYIAEVFHKKLNDFKVFTDNDSNILNSKVKAHVTRLEEKWKNVLQKENLIKTKEDNVKWTEEKTTDAIESLKKIENILIDSVSTNFIFDWEFLKDKTSFSIPDPKKSLEKRIANIVKPQEPYYNVKSAEPNQKNYVPIFSFLDRLFSSKKKRKIEKTVALYQSVIAHWKEHCESIDTTNENKLNEYKKNWKIMKNKK